MTEHARPPTRRSIKVLWMIVAACLLVAVGVVVALALYGSGQETDKETAQAGQAAEQADKKDLATQVAEACAAGGPVGQDLTKRGLCGKAKEIIQEPVKPVESITEQQVKSIVQAEVAKLDLKLTPEEINTVATVAANRIPKPKDGKTPTTAELQPLVSTALATFCANDSCKGEDGEDAPPVTAEQLAATLAAYCEPRNDCMGKDGTNGTNGANGNGIETVTSTTGPDGVTITMTFTDGREPFKFTVLNGKDSTVPGPPGPACPADATLQKKMVITTEEPAGLLVAVCVMNDQG